MKDENFMIMYALIIIGLLIALCGCNSVKYVPIKEIHTDVEHVHDTVKQTDSIWNERTTVIREVDSTELAALGIKINNLQQEKAWLIERDNQRKEKSQGDKIIVKEIIKGDSIPVPCPVEKKLSRWQRFCCDYGKLMLGATIVCLIALSFLLIRYIKRKIP